jgi:hypothetical protein
MYVQCICLKCWIYLLVSSLLILIITIEILEVEMNNLPKVALIGGGIIATRILFYKLVLGALYLKNKVQSKTFKPIEKNKILTILKQIRKESYPLYKRLIPLHHQISMQFKGITPEQFK